jgi:hypothetical protein
VGIVGLTATAVAGDDKVFNGSMCTFTEPGHTEGQERSSIKLWNVSGQTETVGCPLKRDIADNVIHEAYIIGSAEIDEDTCKFWAREDDFTYQSWTHNDVQSVSAGYNKTRFAAGSGFMWPADWASLQITCDVPHNAGVYSYYLWED